MPAAPTTIEQEAPATRRIGAAVRSFTILCYGAGEARNAGEAVVLTGESISINRVGGEYGDGLKQYRVTLTRGA